MGSYEDLAARDVSSAWLRRTERAGAGRRPSESDEGLFSDGHGGVEPLLERPSQPVCRLCRSALSFFFQVAFPPRLPWSDWTLAVFACTDCGSERHLVPESPRGRLKAANISQSFYSRYQSNFRFLAFPSTDAVPRRDYVPRVAFKSWRMLPMAGPAPRKATLFSGRQGRVVVGGRPRWLTEDEAPATYARNEPMTFLMHVPEGYRFGRLSGAPPQVFPRFGFPERIERDYSLFVRNALFFFGTADPSLGAVFVVPQRT